MQMSRPVAVDGGSSRSVSQRQSTCMSQPARRSAHLKQQSCNYCNVTSNPLTNLKQIWPELGKSTVIIAETSRIGTTAVRVPVTRRLTRTCLHIDVSTNSDRTLCDSVDIVIITIIIFIRAQSERYDNNELPRRTADIYTSNQCSQAKYT